MIVVMVMWKGDDKNGGNGLKVEEFSGDENWRMMAMQLLKMLLLIAF